MSETEVFFVVWNPAHGFPRVRHETYPIALAEAKRLARINKGEKFYVLVSCSVVETPDPILVTGLHSLYRNFPDDEIPF